MKKAIVLGWYGAGNVGDELLASQTVDLLEDEGYRSVLISVDPDFSKRIHENAEVIRMYDWAAIAREMASSDLFVIGGGGVFQEYDEISVESLYEFPARSVTFYAQVCLLARQFRVPNVYLAQGVGPLFSSEAKAIVRDLFQHADVVSVRDDESARLLRTIGVSRELIVAPDLTWARDSDSNPKRERNPQQKTVAIVVRHWAQDEANWMQGVDGALRVFHDAGWLVRFVNFGSSTDTLTISDLASRLPDSGYEILDASVSPRTAQALLSSADAALVMRMHGLVLAAQAQVPVVAIAYDAKIDATAELIGLPAAFRVHTSSPATDFEAAARLLLSEETAKAAIGSPERLAELSRAARRHAEALAEGASLHPPSDKTWRAERFDWLSAWFAERESARAAELRRLKSEARAQFAAATELERNLLERLEAADARAAETERDLLQRLEAADARIVETERENRRLTERSGQLQVQVSYTEGRLREIARQIDDKDDKLTMLERLRREHNDATYLLSAMKNSTSWRVTAPLRAMSRVVATLRHRRHSNGARIAFIAGMVKQRGMRETIAWVRQRMSGRAEYNVSLIYESAANANAFAMQMSRDAFLKMIQLEQNKGRIIFAQLPIIDWNVPLYQRPQHMSNAIARQGALVIYTTSNQYDSVRGYIEVSPGVWLTDDGSIYDALDGAIVSLYSTAHFSDYNLLESMRGRNFLIYEYIDHIDEAISGEGVSLLTKLKDYAFSGKANLIAASAARLLEEASTAVGQDHTVYVPNGVDVDHYARAKAATAETPSVITEFASRFRYIVGYFGALAPWIWHEMLNDLTKMRPDLGFVFIGPDYYGGMAKLEKRENLLLTGPVAYLDLPRYAKRFDVSIIPFRPGEIARTTSPLKLFEYFALGTPVVVTDEMLECTIYPEVFSAGDVASFSSALDKALAIRNDEVYKARLHELALENTWDRRAKVLMARVKELQISRENRH